MPSGPLSVFPPPSPVESMISTGVKNRAYAGMEVSPIENIVTIEKTINNIEAVSGQKITIALQSDTSTVNINYSNNSSLSIKFKSGKLINENITITQISNLKEKFPDIPQFLKSLFYYDISLDVPDFSADVFFKYSDESLNIAGIDEEDLTVSFYDSIDIGGFKWHIIPGSIDINNNTIRVSTSHFSLWAFSNSDSDIFNKNIPFDFSLSQNFPNPFNPETTINFFLPISSDIILNIYNIRGQLIRKLVSGQLNAGEHLQIWDGRNDIGIIVSSGIYFARLKAGKFTAIRRMTFLK